jgi:hypothetical protein
VRRSIRIGRTARLRLSVHVRSSNIGGSHVRTLITGLVAGIVVFAWGAISHMVLPTGDMGLKTIPNEAAVLAAMRQGMSKPGVYFFPGIDMKKSTEAEQAAWMEKLRTGPGGLIVYHPSGNESISPRKLITELLSNILAAILVAFVVSDLAPGFWPRVIASVVFGLVAWLSISVSYWNWYGFSPAFIRAELVDQVGAWFFGGLAIAALTRRRARA